MSIGRHANRSYVTCGYGGEVQGGIALAFFAIARPTPRGLIAHGHREIVPETQRHVGQFADPEWRDVGDSNGIEDWRACVLFDSADMSRKNRLIKTGRLGGGMWILPWQEVAFWCEFWYGHELAEKVMECYRPQIMEWVGE